MGIREYFKQHPEEEDLKIHNLNLNRESGKQVGFDFRENFTDEVWQVIEDKLEFARSGGFWDKFSQIAAWVKILFPEKEEDLKLDEEAMRGIISAANEWKDALLERYLSIVSRLKILFPDKIKELNLEKEMWSKLKSSIGNRDESVLIVHYYQEAARLKQLFPDRFKELDFNNSDVILIKKELERWKTENPLMYLGLVADARIIFSEKFRKIEIGGEVWNVIMRNLDSLRKNITKYENLEDFLRLNYYIAVVMADEIDVSEKGLRLIKQKADLKRKETKRPERKQF